MGIHVPHRNFDHRNPNYMSRSLFCRESHCLHETKKIGIVFSVWLVVSCTLPIAISIFDQEFYPEFFVQLLPVVAIILLFLGLKVKRSGLLLPFLLFLGIQVVLFVFLEMGLIIGLCSPTSKILQLAQNMTNDPNTKKIVSGFEDRSVEIKIVMAVGTFVVFFLFASTVWSFMVVQRCGLYLRDLKRYYQSTMNEDAL